MISFEVDGVIFNYRIAAIVIDGKGRILLHTKKSDKFWSLPGGRCEAREFSRQAVKRELMEEIGARVKVGRLAFINENMFVYKKKKYHEIGFYYIVRITDKNPTFKKDIFFGREKEKRMTFKWINRSALTTKKFQPANLLGKIKKMPSHIELIETNR